jgi:catabolite regulation protein CreA
MNKQVQSLCSSMYRARNSVVYKSITALELYLSKKKQGIHYLLHSTVA